jgi:alanyl-tRNA synthetase
MTFVGSAGLAQIENGIEQGEERQGERYVLVQICFRHFDIEKVGKTPVHLSLFGMGGAFSFGEVSRSDTLSKIWSFFTDELGIDTSRLWATCFSGGTLEGHLFPPDETTRETWVALGLNPTHVVEVGIETGFWKQGDGLSGKERYRKCGPTTELFYDRGTHLRCGPGCRPGCGCGRFIEISNILFIHFYIDEATKTVAPIVTPFDETVIGIERVATALCELETVFDLPAFERAIRFIRTAYDPREVMGTDNREESARVIADHARALLFLTADDAPAPGKGGRARIMRLLVRGIVTRLRILRIQNKAFFPDLIDLLLETYGDRYPHLVDGRDKVVTYFDEERETFRQTLSRGYQRLDEILAEDEQAAVSGAQALHLVKEKGLPYPLLKATLEHRSIPFQPQEYWRAHERWYQGILAQTQNAS